MTTCGIEAKSTPPRGVSATNVIWARALAESGGRTGRCNIFNAVCGSATGNRGGRCSRTIHNPLAIAYEWFRAVLQLTRVERQQAALRDVDGDIDDHRAAAPFGQL